MREADRDEYAAEADGMPGLASTAPTVQAVADELAALAREARKLGEYTLAYLIDMAVMEARLRAIGQLRFVHLRGVPELLLGVFQAGLPGKNLGYH